MSLTKLYLEWVSTQLGRAGKITPAVLRAAQREETLSHWRQLQRETKCSLSMKVTSFDLSQKHE